MQAQQKRRGWVSAFFVASEERADGDFRFGDCCRAERQQVCGRTRTGAECYRRACGWARTDAEYFRQVCGWTRTDAERCPFGTGDSFPHDGWRRRSPGVCRWRFPLNEFDSA